MKPADAAYIQVAANPKASLPDRVKSLQSLSAGKDPALAMKLKELLGRPRGNDRPGVNFDPAAAERLVDLQAIAALHRAGDDSEVPRIAKLVAQAGDVLKGADDERRNAAAVIREIGKVEPIADLTRLAGDKDAKAVRNAVLTLQLLNLPQPPVAQPTDGIANLAQPVSFTIHNLKEELETIARVSKGSIVLSSGVTAQIAKTSYDRGEVRRENEPLSNVVERDLPMLGFTCYVQDKTVTICTYAEAGARWQAWWKNYGDQLVYQEAQRAFTLKKPGAKTGA